MITNIGDVEAFMNDFIENKVGGHRVDEDVDKNVSFKNADYRVDYLDQVIELKCLEKNQFEDKTFLDKVSDYHRPYLNELASKNVNEANSKDIAREVLTRFTRDMEKAFYPRIKKIIGKASKQIKETKFNLDIGEFSGVVWIVNDNNIYLTIENQVEIVGRILASESYSAVDAVVLSNLNMQITQSADGVPNLYWVPLFRAGISERTWQTVHYLGHCWQEYVREQFKVSDDLRTVNGVGNIELLKGFSNIKYTKAS